MTNSQTFGSLAGTLTEQGYLPVPIVPNEKKVALKNWVNYRYSANDEKKFSNCGVGLLCGQGDYPIVGIDADTKDTALLGMVLLKVMPYSPMFRAGNAPRVMYVCRISETNFKKMSSSKWDDGKGLGKDSLHQVEFLGYGQQFVAYGIHKDTNKPYEWVTPWGSEPANEKAAELKEITVEAIEDIIKAFDDMCRSQGYKLAERAGKTLRTEHSTEPLTAFDVDCMRCKDIPLSKAKELLLFIDNEAYDKWYQVGMALHLEYKGSEEAFAVWLEWSSGASNFVGEDDLRNHWKSFNEIGKTREKLITMASVRAWSDEARYSTEAIARRAALDELINKINESEDQFTIERIVRKAHLYSKSDQSVLVGKVLSRCKQLELSLSRKVVEGWIPRPNFKYRLTERGLAERMRDRYKGGLIWVPKLNTWMLWTGSYWRKAPKEEVRGFARRTVAELYEEAGKLRGDEGEALTEFAKSSDRARIYNAIVEIVQSFTGEEGNVLVDADELDKDMRYFGVGNGEYDLQTETFNPGTPSHFITKHTCVDYDPDATCPYWDKKFLEIMGSQEMVDFMYRLFGCALTGDTGLNLLPIFFGIGANGKSTVIRTFRRLFGAYSVTAQAATFMKNPKGVNPGGARSDKIKLKGARLADVQETDAGAKLSASAVKEMTGDDNLTARAPYASEEVDFRPTAMIIFATNHKPEVDDQGYAMWRRLLPVHFKNVFDDSAADTQLKHKVEAELSGILNRLLAGYSDFRKRGRLDPPAEVLKERDIYKQESDPLAEWLEECCEITKDLNTKTRRSDLYQSWKAYAADNLVSTYQMRKKWFSSSMKEKFPLVQDRRLGWCYLKIKIRDFTSLAGQD